MRAHNLSSGKRRLAVFGLGPLGRAVVHAAEATGWEVVGYSRSRTHGSEMPFDAASETECRILAAELEPGAFQAAVVTFPPERAAAAFWPLLQLLTPRPILVGTTGIYRRRGGERRITETSPVDPEHPRWPHEQRLLTHGGIVVRLAGLYDEERNPIRWLLEGRVGYEPRHANLIHTEDAAAALVAIAGHPHVASLYNLSDAQPLTWRQIVDHLVERHIIDHPRQPEPPRRPDAYVDPVAFRRDFPEFHFRDRLEELGWLARLTPID